jgi:hypothetical protein
MGAPLTDRKGRIARRGWSPALPVWLQKGSVKQAVDRGGNLGSQGRPASPASRAKLVKRRRRVWGFRAPRRPSEHRRRAESHRFSVVVPCGNPPPLTLRYGRSNLESRQETGQHEARQLVRVPPRPSATYNADQFQTICFARHHHIREDDRDSGGVVLKQAQGFVAISSYLISTADLFLDHDHRDGCAREARPQQGAHPVGRHFRSFPECVIYRRHDLDQPRSLAGPIHCINRAAAVLGHDYPLLRVRAWQTARAKGMFLRLSQPPSAACSRSCFVKLTLFTIQRATFDCLDRKKNGTSSRC